LSDIIKRELNNDGFTIKLFKQNSSGFGEQDRLAIDYLLKFYDEIQGLDQAAVENYDETGYLVPIKQVISLHMDRVLNAQTDASVDQQQAHAVLQRGIDKDPSTVSNCQKLICMHWTAMKTLKSKEFLNIYQMFNLKSAKNI
jgi:tryptophan 2,3-dioxygenase